VPSRRGRERFELLALLASTAALYLWGLSASGWANSFYAAAAQAGADSWKAFFFGSADIAGSITVDKPPLSVWLMSLSVRIFGFSSWSLLVPEALIGVATVAVVYSSVRRVTASPVSGLLAGAITATTPVAVLMFRYDNPDALLVLLLAAATDATLRALDSPRAGRWLTLAGTLVGLAFLTKSLQAFLVLPVLVAVYALLSRASVRRRLVHLVAAFGALLVAGGWWVAVVSLWPAPSRPYVGGSRANSELELILGYNGLGRIDGNESGLITGSGGPSAGPVSDPTGLTRLFDVTNGGQVAWLLPAAVILLVAGLWAARRSGRARAGLLAWGGSLVVTDLVFSLMAGIFHPYYTLAMAPQIGAVVAIGAHAVWRTARGWAWGVLGLCTAVTAVWSFTLLDRTPAFGPDLRWVVLVVGLGAGGALALGRLLSGRLARITAAGALVAVLLGPLAYAIQTAAQAHIGPIPLAGPAVGDAVTAGTATSAAGEASPRILPGWLGGLPDTPGPPANLIATVTRNAGSYTWVAAAVGSQLASGYQLATGDAVMPVGGYVGLDPSPTLPQFEADVAAHRIHWFVANGDGYESGRSLGDSTAITVWVEHSFPSISVDGVRLYDLSQGLAAPPTGPA
jgi:4-amino-4-deoxy-L-arabinose transferase-like glycosyltransferase